MSGIFDKKINICDTDGKEIGRTMFSQIVDDVIEESQKGDVILVSYTVSEDIAREVIRKQYNKFFCRIEFTSRYEHEIKLERFDITIHFIDIRALKYEELQRRMRGRLFDKIVIVDGSFVDKRTKNELRNRIRYANGDDREAFTVFTSGNGYEEENIYTITKHHDVMKLPIPTTINVFIYKEREEAK